MKATERIYGRPVLALTWERRRQWRAKAWAVFWFVIIYGLLSWAVWQLLKERGLV